MAILKTDEVLKNAFISGILPVYSCNGNLVAVVLGRTSVDTVLVNVQYDTNVMPIIDKHLN